MKGTISRLSDILRGMTKDSTAAAEDSSPAAYLISNCRALYGAYEVFLNPDILAGIAEKENANLYILPSSIHETLVMLGSRSDMEYISSMVQSVNREQVLPEERLSNNIYLYNRNTGNIEQLTDIRLNLTD